MEIRYVCSSDDRKEISKIYEESWKSAYKGMIPQHYLDSIPEGRWVSNIDNTSQKTMLCIDNGIIVGTSSFCASRLEQFHGWGEIVSIYFLPEYMGKGYGKHLLQSVINELKKMDYHNIFLWVLEENVRARHFYEKNGFSSSGDYLSDNIGGKDLREVRYFIEQNG